MSKKSKSRSKSRGRANVPRTVSLASGGATRITIRNLWPVDRQPGYNLGVGSDYLILSYPHLGKLYANFKVIKVEVEYIPSQPAYVGGLYALLFADAETVKSGDTSFAKLASYAGTTVQTVAERTRATWTPHEPEDRNIFQFDNAHHFCRLHIAADTVPGEKPTVGYVAGVVLARVTLELNGLQALLAAGPSVDFEVL